MRALSLFSGVGGFDLAAWTCGIEVVACAETDRKCSELLSEKFPTVPNLGDVTKISEEDYLGLGAIDLVTAGWPCQDVSVAGNRAGLAGARSGLWSEVVRALAVLRPLWFVGENVPGLLSSKNGRDFGTVLGQLAELGYGWAYRVLDARYFGVAQRRRRVLIVGCLGDPARAAEVLLEPEGSEWHPAASREAGAEVAHAIRASTSERGTDDPDRLTFVPEVAQMLGGGNYGQGNLDEGVPAVIAHTLRSEGADASEDGTGRGTPLVVAAPLTAGGHPNSNVPGRHAEDDVNLAVIPALTGQGNRQDDQETGQLVFESRFARNGRGAPDAIVPPLKAQSGQSGKGDGAPLVFGVHANQRGEARTSSLAGSLNGNMSGKQYEGVMAQSAVRRLTPVECERLQGFPDDWTEGFSDSARYRMLGNAIAVPMAAWVLRRVATNA